MNDIGRTGHRNRLTGAVALLTTLWPSLAWAHTEQGRAEGFLAGLHHPVSGLDHVLAMVSVGLWGAQLGAPAVWLLPVTFPMVMAFGGMLGLMGVPLPGVEVAIAVSGIALGLAVLAEWRPPLWSAAAVVGFFAIFHGHAHGTELPAGKTIDAMIQVTSAGSYALYDRSDHVTNGAASKGGMYAFFDAAAGAGLLQFASATYSVDEFGASVMVTVDRVGGSAGAAIGTSGASTTDCIAASRAMPR